MSARALEVLTAVDTVAGYTTYVDLIRPLIGHCKVVSTPMQKEVERVTQAIDLALKGRHCAIISSGDPGIYAMAGLVFEVAEKRGLHLVGPLEDPGTPAQGKPPLKVEVVPGIPALAAGAALLGAPLTHDFASISLSDLLTPWDTIAKRLHAAAEADFVIVLYNPKSKRRDWQLGDAQKIILQYRSPQTPVGIVKKAMREGQEVAITTLEELHRAPVDMLTTVFIGNSASMKYLNFMVTPRGYNRKYRLTNDDT